MELDGSSATKVVELIQQLTNQMVLNWIRPSLAAPEGGGGSTNQKPAPI